MRFIAARPVLAGLVTAIMLLAPATASASARGDPPPAPGAAGLGDRLFPLLGNGGYDVQHYDLAFTWLPAGRVLRARTEVTAVATQALSRFDLDFAGNTVQGVTVDGRPARSARVGEELVITPAEPLRRGQRFRAVVVHTGTPTPYQGADPSGTKGFFPTADGFFVAPQPQAAHSVFPSDDHPSDKATITYRLTVPAGLTAAANGVLTDVDSRAASTTWVWQQRQPIATELVTMAVGHYTIVRHPGPGGLPLRDVVPAADATALTPWLDRTAGQIAWLRERLGPYPFDTYGLLMVPGTPEQIGFTEETQTLTVTPEWLADPSLPGPLVDAARVHELTHQWFGDSVSPRRWSDAWLNEGPAMLYAARYAAGHGGVPFAEQIARWYAGSDSGSPFDHPESDQRLRDAYGPPGAPRSAATLYSPSIYSGGALVLEALRARVGDHAFDAIMRAWVTRNRNGNGDTAGFVRLAGEVCGQDLRPLLDDWLYSRTTPPMPH